MCSCNTDTFRYTNISTDISFERCGRTKENLMDTPKNKTCAGVWVPSKKIPCGMLRVFDKDENLLFEGKEVDYFPPIQETREDFEEKVDVPVIVEIKGSKLSEITKKWVDRYYSMKIW